MCGIAIQQPDFIGLECTAGVAGDPLRSEIDVPQEFEPGRIAEFAMGNACDSANGCRTAVGMKLETRLRKMPALRQDRAYDR